MLFKYHLQIPYSNSKWGRETVGNPENSYLNTASISEK